jgi:hypothetical protein
MVGDYILTIKKRVPEKLPRPLNLLMEAASRFELENVGFAGRCLTTWPSRLMFGAGNGS